MIPEQYVLTSLLGAGPDGVAYGARDQATGGPVEVRVLSGASADAERWPVLVKRLRQVRLLDHPGIVGIRELQLERDPPFVVLEAIEQTNLGDDLTSQVPLPALEALALALAVAEPLAAAHRLGIAHGLLGPACLYRAYTGQVKLDFSTIAVRDQGDTARTQTFLASAAARNGVEVDGFDLAADIERLAALAYWLLTGQRLRAGPAGAELHLPVLEHLDSNAAGALEQLLREMAAEPAERPTARLVEERLTTILWPKGFTSIVHGDQHMASAHRPNAPTIHAALPVAQGPDVSNRERLGRYRLLQQVGQGGMGTVYLAEDASDGSRVALKVLRPEAAQDSEILRRFRKEARLLAEVNNPNVANLLEINEDDGIHYLALEYVDGETVRELLALRGHLDEPTALAIMSQVARALVDPHERGIVHRDIKPDNIMLVRAEPANGNPLLGRGLETTPQPANGNPLLGRGLETTPQPAETTPQQAPLHVKLLDFGLARHVVESASLHLTRTGVVVGTPLYMAPEQCFGKGQIDARTDVYALGATLFHMLAGRPPFTHDDTVTVLLMHCNEPPPALKKFNPDLSDGVCQVVAKALAKAPEERYPDAAALLADLEHLARGEPTNIVVHPQLPACDPRKLWQFDWVWELEATPAQLWPYVSNTERLNRAVGLPAVQFTSQVDAEHGVRRFGQFRKAGFVAAWEEHPFEWIEGRRMGVLRVYRQGPFEWLMSSVELVPRDSGTRLTHSVRLVPAGLLGRFVARVEVGLKGRKAVEKVYRRIDATLTGKLSFHGVADAFEAPARLAPARRRRLDALLQQLSECGVDLDVVERLGDFLAQAPAQEVARIRPRALARRLKVDPEQMVAACLHGAREGLLVLLWDILCPLCRIPADIKDTLQALREHGHCAACNLDFELDFANTVELIFRVHPAIRTTELGTYCIGGPVHSPHVAAQVRVAAGERIELNLDLPEGSYRLRGPQLPFTLDFRVQARARAKRWDLNLAHAPGRELPRTLKTEGQTLLLSNDSTGELLVRVERTAPRDDAVTAARASSLALFRELFPGEILTPGQLVSMAAVTLLVTSLEQADQLYQDLGEAQAFHLIHEHLRLVEEHIRREGGALVKTVGSGVLAVFHDPVDAARAACDLPALLAETQGSRDLRVRIGVHRGPAMVASLDGQLDYFGSTVNLALNLPQLARSGEVIFSEVLATDPQVSAWMHGRRLQSTVARANLPGITELIVHRLALTPEAVPDRPPNAVVALAAPSVETRQPDPEEALRQARAALEACLRQLSLNQPQQELDEPSLRRRLFQVLLDSYQQVLAQNGDDPQLHVALGRAHWRLAAGVRPCEETSRAIALYEQAVASYEHLARTHPQVHGYEDEVAMCLNNLGHLYYLSGRFERAESAFRKALSVCESLAGQPGASPEQQRDLATAYNNLGIVQRAAGQIEQAGAAHQQALDFFEQLVRSQPQVGEFVVGQASSQVQLGQVARDQGDLPGALAWFGRAIHALHEVLEREPGLEPARELLENAQCRREQVLAQMGTQTASASAP